MHICFNNNNNNIIKKKKLSVNYDDQIKPDVRWLTVIYSRDDLSHNSSHIH